MPPLTVSPNCRDPIRTRKRALHFACDGGSSSCNVVEHTIGGPNGTLKERLIGVDLFQLPPDFDTRGVATLYDLPGILLIRIQF